MKPISILCDTVLVEHINIFSPVWKADISFSEKWTLYKCIRSAVCERLLLYLVVAEKGSILFFNG